MAQKERENFYRNSTVIVDHGTESLSEVLDNDLTNQNITFEDFINRHQHDIYHLCYNKFSCCQCPAGRFVPANQSRILYPDQLDILLDGSGSTLSGHNPNAPRISKHCCRPAKKNVSTSDLDITLLRCLLINFAQNCRTNSILRQDVEGLVKCRNKLYGHAQEARISDSDYSKYKTDVEDIILRIARFCSIEDKMRQKLNDASQRPLDETILEKYKVALIQQSLHEKNIEEKVDGLKKQLTAIDERLHCHTNTLERKVNAVGQGEKNIIAHTEDRLLEHSKDDTYVITEDVKQGCEILETYKILVIIAKAGGGKSTTSLQIAMLYQNRSYTPMLFVNDEVARYRHSINFDCENIVIIEDLFGRSNIDFNEDLHRGILDVFFYSCIKNESCKTKLILTIRGDDKIIRKLMEKHRFFEKGIFLNLEKTRTWYSNTLIFSKHMEKHGISLCECRTYDFNSVSPVEKRQINIGGTFSPPEVVRQCTADVFEINDNSMKICLSFFYDVCCGKAEMLIGFPQACHLFCSDKNLAKQGMGYFTHTSQSLVSKMNKLKTEGFDKNQSRYQYCVLVYTAMKNSINLDEIDDKCFQNILTSIYEENKKIKRPLLKASVLAMDGTYISKTSSISKVDQDARPIVPEIYVLQHYTIREAILVSYGDDTDVLTFCDFNFLQEYVRPNSYRDEFSDTMVFLYTDYKPLVKRLASMALIDAITCTSVGVYLQRVALRHRRDDIIQHFFQNLESVTPEHYLLLINGLTSFGENAELVKFHPELCDEIMVHSGLTVFLAFCRPIGWLDKDTHFIQKQTEFLLKKLYQMIAFSELYENETEPYRSFFFPKMKSGRYAVGNYVFENLIAKGFHDIVITLFAALKTNAPKIRSTYIHQFLDGLLDEGRRSSIVTQFKDFFEALLFKYGSIQTILRLCRPLTASMSNSNIIQVDDRLLTGKLSAYLESEDGCSVLKRQTPVDPREDEAYFVYWDYNYLRMNYIDDMAKFVSEYGIKLNNDNFVRMMYEQLVPGKEEKSDSEESVTTYSKTTDYDKKNRDEFDKHTNDGIKEDENAKMDYSGVTVRFVKKIYSERTVFTNRTTYKRLYKFLSFLMLEWQLEEDTSCKRMQILRSKFELLLNCTDTGPDDVLNLKLGKSFRNTFSMLRT